MGIIHTSQQSRILLILVSILVICSSCVTSNLQTASIKGLETKSIARLAKDDYQPRVTLRPSYFNNIDHKLALNTGTHSKVNTDGIYELEPGEAEDLYFERRDVNRYEFEGKNLVQNIPPASFGFDFEYTVSGRVVTLGLQYGKMGKYDFLNGLFGISFFHEKAFRIGMNLYFQSTNFEALVLHVNDSYSNGIRDVEIGRVEGRESFVDMEAYLNWRSYFQKYLFIDVFFEGAFGTQSLIDMRHNAKGEAFHHSSSSLDYDDKYVTFTFGGFKDIGNNTRILAGYKMNFHEEEYSNLDIRTDSFFIQFEYDFILTE